MNHQAVRALRAILVAFVAFAAFLVAPRVAHAEEPIDSTTDLKHACEEGLHHVYVTIDIKITQGPAENVASGCKISLGPLASFEATHVSMTFAGPFQVYSSRERSVTFANSEWKAPSLSFFGDAVSSFKNTASLLQATAGDIKISVLGESAVQLQDRPGGSANGLKASGRVSITGGDKLLVSLDDTGIEGRKGVQFNLWGRDGALKAWSSEVVSPVGGVSISGSLPKAVVELKDVTLASGRGSTAVSLGSESLLWTEFTHISSQRGSVDLLAGSQGQRFGVVELVDTTIVTPQALSVRGSPEGEKGTVKVAKSTFSAGADVAFVTGPLGATEVTGSSITSGTAVRILSGTGGTCKAEKNTYQAPLQQICA